MNAYFAQAERALLSATTLLEDGDPSGSVNRAHYSMFDAAKAALAHLGYDAAEISSKHSGLINKFGELVVVPGFIARDLERSLQYAFKLRQVADYDAEPIPSEQAQKVLADAQEFLAAIQQLVSRPYP